jgi:3-oxoacyl-[acyl-carrier protein] reductase
MDLGLADKTVLVLGASSGLVLAIANCMAQDKARVVMSARKGARLDQALMKTRQINPSATALPVDLQNAAAMDAVEANIRELKPDILVTYSGGPPPGSAVTSDLESWWQ